MNLSNFSIDSSSMETLLHYGFQLVTAVITLAIGWWIIGMITRGIQRLMNIRSIDPTLQGFVTSVLGIALKIMLIISVASMVGIATTSFVAVLGAASLAVGMALQGSLGNFAGGVMILLFRPFKVGDNIVASGVEGAVQRIDIFHTILRTTDNRIIYVPNGTLSNQVVTNTSHEARRRTAISVLIDYEDDIDQAREIMLQLAREEERVLKEPAPSVFVAALNDANVKLTLLVWSKTSDASNMSPVFSEAVVKALRAAGFRLGVNTRNSL